MFPENDKPCLSIGALKHKKNLTMTIINSHDKCAVMTTLLSLVIPEISQYLSLQTRNSDLTQSYLIKSVLDGDFSNIHQIPEKVLNSFHLLLKEDDFVIKYLTTEVVEGHIDEQALDALTKATTLRINSEHEEFNDFTENKDIRTKADSFFSKDGKYKTPEIITFIRSNAHEYPSSNIELAIAELLEFMTSEEHNPHHFSVLKSTIEDELPSVYRLCRDADVSSSGHLDMIMYQMINHTAMPPFYTP